MATKKVEKVEKNKFFVFAIYEGDEKTSIYLTDEFANKTNLDSAIANAKKYAKNEELEELEIFELVSVGKIICTPEFVSLGK